MKLTEDMERDLSTAAITGNEVSALQGKMAPISPSTACAVTEVSAVNKVKGYSSVNCANKSLLNGKVNCSDKGLLPSLEKHSDEGPEDEEGLGVEVETYSGPSSPESLVNGHENENSLKKPSIVKCNGVKGKVLPDSNSKDCQIEPDDLNLSVQSDEFHLRMSDDDAEEQNDVESSRGNITPKLGDSELSTCESGATTTEDGSSQFVGDGISCDKGSGVMEVISSVSNANSHPEPSNSSETSLKLSHNININECVAHELTPETRCNEDSDKLNSEDSKSNTCKVSENGTDDYNTISLCNEDTLESDGKISPDECANSSVKNKMCDNEVLGATKTVKSVVDNTLEGSKGESCEDLLKEIDSLCGAKTWKQDTPLMPVVDSKNEIVSELHLGSSVDVNPKTKATLDTETDSTSKANEGAVDSPVTCALNCVKESKCDVDSELQPVSSQSEIITSQSPEQQVINSAASNIASDKERNVQKQSVELEMTKTRRPVLNETPLTNGCVGGLCASSYDSCDGGLEKSSVNGGSLKTDLQPSDGSISNDDCLTKPSDGCENECSISQVLSREGETLLQVKEPHGITKSEEINLNATKSDTRIASAKIEETDAVDSVCTKQAEEVMACKEEDEFCQKSTQDGDKSNKQCFEVIEKERRAEYISGKDEDDAKNDSDCEVVTQVLRNESVPVVKSAFDKLLESTLSDTASHSESLGRKSNSLCSTPANSKSPVECLSERAQSSLLEAEEDSYIVTPSVTFTNDTGFDVTSDNQDSLSSVQHDDSLSSKENDLSVSSRKRTLSFSDDDSQDSVKKKLNGFNDDDSEKTSGLETSEATHKRHASETVPFESKKIRMCKEVQESSQEQEDEKQMKDCEKLQNIQEAASSRGVHISEPRRTPQSNLDLAIECVVAKAATAAAPSKPLDLPVLRKLFKGEFKTLSRSDLEELVLQKICEAITERGITGELRLRCQTLEKNLDKGRDKYNSLRKQMHELGIVVKKNLEQTARNAAARPNPPVRITRSVGLQVTLPVNRQIGSAVRPRVCLREASSPNVTPQTVTSPKTTPPAPVRIESPKQHPQQLPQAQVNVPVTARTHLSGPRVVRPVTNVPASATVLSGPPALVPTSAPSSTVFVSMPITMSGVGPRQAIVSSPRAKAPVQQLNPSVRPRLSAAPNLSTSVTQPQHVQRQLVVQNKQIPPQPGIKQAPANSDVEVIDIIDKEDQTKQPVRRISQQQHQHQQQQAANAAAQNLAANGMTVRLVSPSQPGMTLQSVYVPNQGGNAPKMFITSASQANQLRGKTHIIMKGNASNLLIPLQQSQGVAVSNSAVVHAVATAQSTHPIPPVQQVFTTATGSTRTSTVATVRPPLPVQPPTNQRTAQHPAPLPRGPGVQASNTNWKLLPPKPSLKIQHQNNGIVLSWNMALGPAYADIESYQLYAYQEGAAPPSASLWKKVGDVKALPLPMACTLTQFVEGHRYHFTVRAVDKHNRVGPFSQPGSIRLGA